MTTVTRRIKQIEQPKGGYLNPKSMIEIDLDNGVILNSIENIAPAYVGLTVDYLTRFIDMLSKGNGLEESVKDAFSISLRGSLAAYEYGIVNALKEAYSYLDNIKGLDDISIINACKLVTFDDWYRNGMLGINATKAGNVNPDKATIENIRIMVDRVNVFKMYFGEIKDNEITFEPEDANIELYNKLLDEGKGTYGGYTATVAAGDGDFITRNCLWDMKVSKYPPSMEHTLQILMYWVMSRHSGKKCYEQINTIGIYNPRLGKAYTADTRLIDKRVIEDIEKKVICYE